MNNPNMAQPSQVSAQIVGIHFRPPAKQVLAHLPAGARLWLVPEPDNPYDAKAIKVMVSPKAIPESEHASLEFEMEGTGFFLVDVLEESRIWLGYVADSDGKACRAAAAPGNREIGELAFGILGEAWQAGAPGTLTFDPAGKPCVSISRETIAQPENGTAVEEELWLCQPTTV